MKKAVRSKNKKKFTRTHSQKFPTFCHQSGTICKLCIFYWHVGLSSIFICRSDLRNLCFEKDPFRKALLQIFLLRRKNQLKICISEWRGDSWVLTFSQILETSNKYDILAKKELFLNILYSKKTRHWNRSHKNGLDFDGSNPVSFSFGMCQSVVRTDGRTRHSETKPFMTTYPPPGFTTPLTVAPETIWQRVLFLSLWF